MANVRTAVPGSAFISQVAIETLYANPAVAARLSQETIEVLTRVGVVIVSGGVGHGHGGGHKATVRIIEVGGLATARMAPPSVPGAGGAIVNAVAAKATAKMAAPVVHGNIFASAAKATAKMAAPLERIRELAPASVATAHIAAPVVSGGSAGGATVQAVAARATAAMAPPAVPGSSQPVANTGGSRIIRRPRVIHPREKSAVVYAEAAHAAARGGNHIIVADNTNLDDLDAEFTDFFKELLSLELIAA